MPPEWEFQWDTLILGQSWIFYFHTRPSIDSLVGFKNHKPSGGRLCGATMEGWTAGLTIAGKSFFATPSGFLQNRDNLLPNWYLLVVEPYPSEKWWSSSMGKMTSHILGKIKMFERIQLNNPCFLLGPPSNPPQECGTLAGRAAKNRSCSEYGHWIWWFSPTFHESLALYLSIYLSLSLCLSLFLSDLGESHTWHFGSASWILFS